MDFPFKGDETALRSMEHAELISVVTQDGRHPIPGWMDRNTDVVSLTGRPSTIRPGRPVLRWVFERLVKGMSNCFFVMKSPVHERRMNRSGFPRYPRYRVQREADRIG